MKNISVLSENFQFLEVKCSIYLNRRVFVMVLGLYNSHRCFNVLPKKKRKKYFRIREKVSKETSMTPDLVGFLADCDHVISKKTEKKEFPSTISTETTLSKLFYLQPSHTPKSFVLCHIYKNRTCENS